MNLDGFIDEVVWLILFWYCGVGIVVEVCRKGDWMFVMVVVYVLEGGVVCEVCRIIFGLVICEEMFLCWCKLLNVLFIMWG